jgi:flagellar hook-associated protein 2
MPTISFGGLASGLDTSAIISALMKIEQQPIQKLEAEKKNANFKIDLIGSFEKYVDKLHDAAKELSTKADFTSYSVGVSEEGHAGITVTGAPAVGGHTIKVNALATADRWSFQGAAPITDDDTDVLLTDQTLSFSYGTTNYNVALTAGTSSLNEIASAINQTAGADVTASVVNTGTAGTPVYKLVVTGDETGVDNEIVFSAVPTELGSGTELTDAVNASITVDGLTVERSTNEFSDVVDGLSIDAQSADPTKTISFTVSIDAEGIKTKLKSFISAWNNVMEFVNDQNTFDPKAEVPVLFGEGLLFTARSEIRNAMFNLSAAEQSALVSNPTGYDTLSIIGIKSNVDGSLEINEKKLDEKLSANPELFADLFVDTDGFSNGGVTDPNSAAYYTDTTADHGLMEKLWRGIDKMKDSKTTDDGVLPGLFKARKQTLQDTIKRYDDQILRLIEQSTQLEEQLVLKFSKLEELMGGLNSQQAQLSAIMGGF